MRILYLARTADDTWYLAADGLYTGTPLKIVLAMKRTSFFGARAALACYLQFHRDRLQRLHGVTLSLTSDTPEAQAASFLHALFTLGMVRSCDAWPMKGETDAS